MKKLLRFSFLFLLLVPGAVGLVQCSSQLVAVVPSTSYPVQHLTRMRRTNPLQEAIVLGHIDELQSGRLFPSGSSVCIDKELPCTNSDANGMYMCVLAPGTHSLLATYPGLIPSLVDQLEVKRGDSIRLDFHLRADTTTFHSN